jgi:elongation factor 1-gamma
VASQNEKTSLLGKTKQDYATILRWMSFANTEVLTPLGGWFRPILGRDPYNKKNVDDSQKAALKAVHVLEEHLLTHTYLVNERLTLADLFAASILARGFQYFFDKQWRDANPNVTRWYETVCNQSSYSAVAGKLEFITEALKNVAPKKEGQEKKKEPKAAAPKPKKEEAEEEEEEAAPAPKAKHPLEALPRATFVLDDWKRKYSNEETREVALPWFWENVNFEEYSLYQVDYKYNDELTLTFMTANLIGMFIFPFLLCSPTNRLRWFLRPSRGQPQVPFRLRFRVRRGQQVHHQGCLPCPWPGGSPRFRRRPRLRELRVHQARPHQGRGQGVCQRPVVVGQAHHRWW